MGNKFAKRSSSNLAASVHTSSFSSSSSSSNALRFIVRENQNNQVEATSVVVKPRLLCLHGWRTSAEILEMQTAAMRYHTLMDCVLLEAPFQAVGPPDEGIAMFYPDRMYY
jgi:hypothetical protein